MLLFSYQKLIQKVVDEAIFNRGIKDFLEGKVIKKKNLILDHWRIYEVVDKFENELKIPILHYLISKDKYDLAGKAILEVYTCSCNEYWQNGNCRHLVAVCCHLDQEFKLLQSQNQKILKEEENILDNIFEAEINKFFREFTNYFEQYLINPKSLDWVAKIGSKISSNYIDYEKLLEDYKKTITEYLEEYSYQKMFIKIVVKFLSLDKKNWWNYFFQFFPLLNMYLLENLVVELWEIYYLNFCTDYKQEIEDFLINLNEETKSIILEKLKQKFSFDHKIWLDFIIKTNYKSWIIANMDYLDPVTLLKLSEKNKDYIDKIEIILLNQIKNQSNFLTSDKSGEQYQEIINIFQLWEEKIGRTENYEIALNYLKSNHSRKKTLF